MHNADIRFGALPTPRLTSRASQLNQDFGCEDFVVTRMFICGNIILMATFGLG
jgi:hypothetical protein